MLLTQTLKLHIYTLLPQVSSLWSQDQMKVSGKAARMVRGQQSFCGDRARGLEDGRSSGWRTTEEALAFNARCPEAGQVVMDTTRRHHQSPG